VQQVNPIFLNAESWLWVGDTPLMTRHDAVLVVAFFGYVSFRVLTLLLKGEGL